MQTFNLNDLIGNPRTGGELVRVPHNEVRGAAEQAMDGLADEGSRYSYDDGDATHSWTGDLNPPTP